MERAYIFDTHTQTDRGDNQIVIVLEDTNTSDMESQLYDWLRKHEPDHYRTTTRRYRVLYAN